MTRNTRLGVGALGLICVLGVSVVVRNNHHRPTTTPVSQSSVHRNRNESNVSPLHVASQPMAKRLTSQAARELRTAIEASRQRRETATTATTSSGRTSSSSQPELPDPLDRGYVRDAVKAIVPLLSECYARALERRPEIAGTVVVNFTIVGEPNAGGLIGDSVINPTGTSIDDALMRECVQETMYAIQIDPPKHGGQIEVEYPFAFSR